MARFLVFGSPRWFSIHLLAGQSSPFCSKMHRFGIFPSRKLDDAAVGGESRCVRPVQRVELFRGSTSDTKTVHFVAAGEDFACQTLSGAHGNTVAQGVSSRCEGCCHTGNAAARGNGRSEGSGRMGSANARGRGHAEDVACMGGNRAGDAVRTYDAAAQEMRLARTTLPRRRCGSLDRCGAARPAQSARRGAPPSGHLSASFLRVHRPLFIMPLQLHGKVTKRHPAFFVFPTDSFSWQ